MLKSEGVFDRTGDMLIWLTDDERRIPILMKSKVKIGSITATLVGGTYWPPKKKGAAWRTSANGAESLEFIMVWWRDAP